MSEELKKEAQILKKKTEEEEGRALTEKDMEQVAGGVGVLASAGNGRSNCDDHGF